jgi:hypothetical protein
MTRHTGGRERVARGVYGAPALPSAQCHQGHDAALWRAPRARPACVGPRSTWAEVARLLLTGSTIGVELPNRTVWGITTAAGESGVVLPEVAARALPLAQSRTGT